jgi:hypothetical protein
METNAYILSENHWIIEDHKQRLSVQQWRQILLESRDTIIFRGELRKLIATNIGYGVVEVCKGPRE